jgi:hypothetical protein
MIDLRLVGKKYGPISFQYTWKDVVLYALGIGAQAEEIQFIYENAKGGLRVFPSFSMPMGIGLFLELFKDMKVDLSRFIHGEQAIKLYRPIPPEGKTLIEGEITNIYDKLKAALIVWRKKVMTEGGDPLAETDSGIFYVGEGGFGVIPVGLVLFVGLLMGLVWAKRYIDVIAEGYQYRTFTMTERVLTQFRVFA